MPVLRLAGGCYYHHQNIPVGVNTAAAFLGCCHTSSFLPLASLSITAHTRYGCDGGWSAKVPPASAKPLRSVAYIKPPSCPDTDRHAENGAWGNLAGVITQTVTGVSTTSVQKLPFLDQPPDTSCAFVSKRCAPKEQVSPYHDSRIPSYTSTPLYAYEPVHCPLSFSWVRFAGIGRQKYGNLSAD